MKICLFAPANSIHSYRWVKYFAVEGHEMHWVSMHQLDFDVPSGVLFYQFGVKLPVPLKYIYTFTRIKWLLRGIKPDILHVHSLGAYGLGSFCGFHPLVATAWGSDVLFAGDLYVRRKYIQNVLRRADCITCDAYHMRDEMLKLVPDVKGRLKLINFGIETGVFRPKERNNILREQLGVYGNPVVISLRSFLPIYDVQTLIMAVPFVLTVAPSTKFLVIGTGPEEKLLKKLVESMNLSRSVFFLGRIDNKNLPEYLAAADVYVSTALSDAGIAASTAEAMSCGLPVVVTDSGENKKWIKDGESGFVVPVKSPMVLAEKIIYLLKDKSKMASFGNAGRKIIQERNDYRTEMAKMGKIYKELMVQ